MAMNADGRKVAQVPMLARLRLAAGDPVLRKHFLRWVIPLLFAVFISSTIRDHSLAPSAAMERTVGNILAVVALALAVLVMSGRRLAVSADVALLLVAFAAAATLSVVGSGGINFSLLRLQLYLATTLLAVSIYLGYRDKEYLPLEAFFLGIAIVHLPFLLGAVLWIRDLEPPFWRDGPRLAHFANVRQYAEFGFLAAASSSALCVLSRRYIVPSLLLAGCGVFGLVLTGSRGALLAWMIFAALAFCLCRARFRMGLHAFLVLGSSCGLVWYLDRAGILPSPNIFARIASQAQGVESFDTSRLQIWLSSLQQILARPLFGSGPEGYWLSGCCDRRILQAHNFVLQFLMEFGAIGCGIIALLFFKAIRALGGLAGTAKAILATNGNRTLACLLASFFAYGLVDQMMYHVVPLLHLGVFAGLFGAGLVQAHRPAS